ncbi:hypothetical protein E5288_WYG014894 [Bos mutus]|uniref:Uncharacterized protein n=1 Tax=Bos mutus TaxID=72004 RepID=A0A6B0S4V0_9CETA|nr:hypothetical protein [Bos mutus]
MQLLSFSSSKHRAILSPSIKENSINVENYSYQSPEMRVQLFAPPPPEREGIQGEDVSTLATSVDAAVRVDTRCGLTVSSVS